MARYKAAFYAPEGWNFKNHMFLGTQWNVPGSKAGSSYEVDLTNRGFTCSCPGFSFRGKCKHTQQVAERFDDQAD